MTFTTTLRSVEFLTPEAFTSYINTLLWSSTDDDGDTYDSYCNISDLDEDELEIQWNECHEFLKQNAELINQLTDDGYELETIMHDFCLTRNGEGCGFWEDDEYPHEIGLKLTEAAHKFSPVNLYTGDDGQVYIFVG